MKHTHERIICYNVHLPYTVLALNLNQNPKEQNECSYIVYLAYIEKAFMRNIEYHAVLSTDLPEEGVQMVHDDLLDDTRIPACADDGVAEDVHDARILAAIQELQFITECLARVPCHCQAVTR